MRGPYKDAKGDPAEKISHSFPSSNTLDNN
jgi:hypothetical protein